MNGFDLSTISDLYVGSTQASAIYYGSNLIWQSHDYSQDYLTIILLSQNSSITWKHNASSTGGSRTISYSFDKNVWTEVTSTENGVLIASNMSPGTQVYFKGTNTNYGATRSGTYMSVSWLTKPDASFVLNECNVAGNIMSMLKGDNFINDNTFTADYALGALFYGNTSLYDASNLKLPSTTLRTDCYRSLFEGCTNLTGVPELPATSLANSCYERMFAYCTSLTTAPNLPATSMGDNSYDSMFFGCSSLTTAPNLPCTSLGYGCYTFMFGNCTSLTTAPNLPSTSINSWCYQYMFYGCTSLTTAPELPAQTLKQECYRYMFTGCSSLNYIKCLATNISATRCTYNWVSNVPSIGTFVKAASMQSWATGASGIPTGWTIHDIV